MNALEVEKIIIGLFESNQLGDADTEYGFIMNNTSKVEKIGYATNLTPEVIENASKQQVDLLITHHDAWDFMDGMKQNCINLLKKNHINHCFFHLPLDDVDFGTNHSFLEKLDATITDKCTLEDERYYCGRIGEIKKAIPLENLVNKIENLVDEKVHYWKNNDQPIKKIGFVAGAGHSPSYIKEYVEKKCDVYMTGEKNLYTVLFCKFAKINLIVGSHTNTEIFGVESFCKKIKEKCGNLEIVRIVEKNEEIQ